MRSYQASVFKNKNLQFSSEHVLQRSTSSMLATIKSERIAETVSGICLCGVYLALGSVCILQYISTPAPCQPQLSQKASCTTELYWQYHFHQQFNTILAVSNVRETYVEQYPAGGLRLNNLQLQPHF